MVRGHRILIGYDGSVQHEITLYRVAHIQEHAPLHDNLMLLNSDIRSPGVNWPQLISLHYLILLDASCIAACIHFFSSLKFYQINVLDTCIRMFLWSIITQILIEKN